ncbi:MAG: hypothetical protein Q7S05_03250 [bacterium]|nr:hypothetical protein [bacterium]
MDLLLGPLLLWITTNYWKTGLMVIAVIIVIAVVLFLREIGRVSQASDEVMKLRQEADE